MSNRITPPRSKDSFSGSSPRPKMRSDLRNISDPSVFSAVLFKEKDKIKDKRRSDARDRKMRWKPQARVANSEFVASSHQEPFSNGEIAKVYEWEPQSSWLSGMNMKLGLDAESTATIKEVKDSFHDLAASFGQVKAEIGLNKETGILVTKMTEGMSDVATFLLLVAVLWIIKPETQNEKIMAMFMIVGVLSTRNSLKDFFMNSPIGEWLKGSEIPAPQMFGFAPDCDSLATILVTVMNTFVCVKAGSAIFEPKFFVRTMSELGKAGSTITNMVRGVNLLVTYVYSSIDAWYSGKTYFTQTGHQFIDVFLQEATEIIDSFESKTLYNLDSSVDRVKAAIEQGTSIQMKVPGGGQFTGVRACVLNHITELVKIRKALMASNFKYSGIRQEPAVLYLVGPPGSMKSQAMQHVAHYVNARLMNNADFELYCEQPSTGLHNRQFENDFWDGYKQSQNIVIFDDILQAKDIAGSPNNEAMNFIRSVNVFPYELHMAKIDDKGSTNFRSKFVLANSNMKNIVIDSIHDVGAFLRRLDLVYDVCLKAEYCIDPSAPLWHRKPDKSKFPVWTAEEAGEETSLIGTTRTHPSMCDFHLQKLKHGHFVDAGVVHSFTQVLENYYQVYLTKEAQFKSYLKTLDETLYGTRESYQKYLFDLGREPQEDFESTYGTQIDQDTDEIEMFEPQMDLGRNPNAVVFTTDESGLETGPPNEEELSTCLVTDAEAIAEPLDEDYLRNLLMLAFRNIHAYRLLVCVMTRVRILKRRLNLNIPDRVLYGMCFNRVEATVKLFFDIDLARDGGVGWVEDLLDEAHVCQEAIDISVIFVYRLLISGADEPEPEYEDLPQYTPQMLHSSSSRTQSERTLSRLDLLSHLSPLNVDVMMAIRASDYQMACAMEIVMTRMINEAFMRTGYIILPDDAANCVIEAADNSELFDLDMLSDNMEVVMEKVFDIYASAERGTTSQRRNLLIKRCKDDLVALVRNEIPPWVAFIGNVYHNCVLYLGQLTIIPDVLRQIGYMWMGRYGIYAQVSIVATSIPIFTSVFNLVFKLVMPLVLGNEPAKSKKGKETWLRNPGFKTMKLVGKLFPHSDERRSKNPQRSKVTRLVRPQAGDLSPQSVTSSNPNLISVMQMMMRKSIFTLWVPLPVDERTEEKTHQGSGFAVGLKGRTLLIPYHFGSLLQTYVDDEIISLQDVCALKRPLCDEPYFYFTVQEFLSGFFQWKEGEAQDLALLRMPSHFQPVKDVLSHFATEKYIERYKKFEAVLWIPRAEDNRELHSVVAERRSGPIEIGSARYEEYTVQQVYEYAAHTSEGDCGALLYVNDTSNPSLVTGMHIAGSTGRKCGMAAVLSREFLEDALSLAGEDYVEEPLELKFVPVENPHPQMGCFGKVVDSPVPQRIKRSKLRPSPLKDKAWVSLKRPSRLMPFVNEFGEKIDPLVLATHGYGQPDIICPDEDIVAARDSLYDYLCSRSTKDVERRVLSFEEAVLGKGPGSAFTSIPRGTSAGYPYNCDGGISSKHRFFGFGEEFDFSSQACVDLQKSVRYVSDCAQRGVRCVHIFTDSLKDERRSFKKWERGDTRLFSGCPIVLLIVSRQYFGAFQEWIVENRIRNGVAIGINEYGSEWDSLGRELLRFGNTNNVGAGDYQGFDKRHKAKLLNALLWIINKWYNGTPAEEKARKTLWLELTNSKHINDGVLFEWSNALPSGHPLTAFVNSLYNPLIKRIVFDRIVPEPFRGKFNFMVYLIVLGDDNVFSVDPVLVEYFREELIAVEMLKLGQVYTPEDKDKAEHGLTLRRLEDVTFLKRKFRFFRGRWIAPLDLGTIMDIPNWTRDGPNIYADTESNVQVALEELTLHGRDVFEELGGRLIQAVRDTHGLSEPECTSFDVLYQKVIHRDGDRSEYRSIIPGYGVTGGKKAEPQIGSERSDDEQAAVFTVTSRMACWQPQLNPGSRKPHVRLIQRRVVNRIATTNTNPALGNDNRLTVSRLEAQDGLEDNSSSSVTRMVSDADVVVAKPLMERKLDSSLVENATTGNMQSVADFLSRPLMIFGGAFATTDIPNTPIGGFQSPQGPLGLPIFNDKIKGAGAFRGDLHVTINFNANRFQQGRYMLVWIPTGGAVGYDVWDRMHRATLVETTQCPHVEFDLSCDTSATLVVPYVTAQGWAATSSSTNLTTNLVGMNGWVRLIPYSPLVAPTGSSTANYTVFVHFENVEFAMAIAPQAGGARVKTRVRRRVGPAASEQKSQNIGPLESAFSSLSLVAGKMNGIPLLSSVSHTAGWAADLAASVAGAFGWSRPHNSEHSTMMIPYNNANRMTNVDVADNSTKLGYFDRNEIEDVVGFSGTDIDEMSLAYVQSISAYNSAITWSNTAVYGTRLVELFCCPRDYVTTTVQSGVNITHMSPVSFVSSFFSLYRGSLRFTFKIVKTEFHSGRLQISFFPFDTINGAVPTSPSTYDCAYLHREIIDVRDKSEFTFVAPYTSFSQYRSMSSSDRHYGKLLVDVLDPLVAPSSVSSSVSIIIEVSGAEDLEFAQPAAPAWQVCAQYVPQAGGNTCLIVAEDVGHSNIGNNGAAAKACIGERVTSFRQILKRFSLFNKPASIGYSASTNMMQVTPFINNVSSIGSSLLFTQPAQPGDLITSISACYALLRGSVRFKFIDPTTATAAKVFISSYALDVTQGFKKSVGWTTANDTAYWQPNRTQAFFRTDIGGVPEVEVPFYSRYHSTAVADTLATDKTTIPDLVYTGLGTGPRQVFNYYTPNVPAADPLVYRSAGEDFSLGLFVSVPPVVGWTYNMN